MTAATDKTKLAPKPTTPTTGKPGSTRPDGGKPAEPNQ